MHHYRNCHPGPSRRTRRTTNTRRQVLVFSNVLLRSIILLLLHLHLYWSFPTAIARATLTMTTAISTIAAAATPVEEVVVAQQQQQRYLQKDDTLSFGILDPGAGEQVIDLVDKEESTASAVSVSSLDNIEYAYVPFPLWIIGIELTLLLVSLLLCVGCWIFVYIFRNKMIVAIGQP